MSGIHEAIALVSAEIPAIGKDKKNQQQGFNYRGIDDVYNVISPLMAKYKIIMVPQVVESTREERINKNQTVLTFVTLKIRYRFFSSDGSSLEENLCPVVIGEGMDSGDKATNKAMSIAHKYAMFQMFCIPTAELVDPDAESHTVVSTPKTYNLDEIKAKMTQLPTAESVTEYLRSLAIPPQHPQRPAITAMYQACMTQPQEASHA